MKIEDVRDRLLNELSQGSEDINIEISREELKSLVDTLNRAIKEIRVIHPLKLKENYRLGAEDGGREVAEDVLKLLEEKRFRVINYVLFNEIRDEIWNMKG